MMRRLFFLLTVPMQWMQAAEPMDVGFEMASSLPLSLVDYLHTANGLGPYALDAWLNPFYLQGDFNGDGSLDTAVLLREKDSGKVGILIHHGGTRESFVLGAGSASGNGGDDFSWLNAWRVLEGHVRASPESPGKPKSHDALFVTKLEAAGGILYWTGKGYAWKQHGD